MLGVKQVTIPQGAAQQESRWSQGRKQQQAHAPIVPAGIGAHLATGESNVLEARTRLQKESTPAQYLLKVQPQEQREGLQQYWPPRTAQLVHMPEQEPPPAILVRLAQNALVIELRSCVALVRQLQQEPVPALPAQLALTAGWVASLLHHPVHQDTLVQALLQLLLKLWLANSQKEELLPHPLLSPKAITRVPWATHAPLWEPLDLTQLHAKQAPTQAPQIRLVGQLRTATTLSELLRHR